MPGHDDPAVVVFDAPLQPLAWGRSTYTVVVVPGELVDAAAAAGTRRVTGVIEDVEVNLALNRADVLEEPFLYAGKGLQRRLGATPGDVVRCRLGPADPDDVLVAADVREALEAAGVDGAFDALRPAERRRLLQPVEEAAREETRRRRVAALVGSLR